MARVHKPEPGIERAIALGIEAGAGYHPDNKPGLLAPYSYGTPCFWAWTGAYHATLKARQ